MLPIILNRLRKNTGHLFLVVLLQTATAQNQTAPQSTTIPARSETMVVLGSATPVPLAESPRSVVVLPLEGEKLAAETPLDFLRQDSSIFLEQRGAGGAQSDLVLRGGSFEQTLVLLNGFRINDSQTSHHNLDLPVPLEAMNSIQVLEGAGSTLHGVDALSGVVDFLTAAPEHDSLLLRTAAGSFESNEESLLAGATKGRLSGRLTASRNFSTGFMPDRDYRNEDASAESWLGTQLGITDLMLASSDRSFGANQFYGPYNSWERTKSWFASARQELGSRTVAAFGYRRHTDEFILLRDDPSVYENNHIDGSWQASLRRTVPVQNPSLLLLGLEADGDSINSHNFSGGVTSFALGVHARNRGAGYVDLDLRPAKQRWNLSAGAREEIFSGGAQSALLPNSPEVCASLIGLSCAPAPAMDSVFPPILTSITQTPPRSAIPTSSPSQPGPATAAWIGRLPVAYPFQSPASTRASTTQSTTCAPTPTQKWQAVNLSGLQFAGVESTFTWVPGKVADRAHCLDRAPRCAECAPRPPIRVRFQLSGPEHPRRMDCRTGPRFRDQQYGADCPALPADGLSGLERHAHARLRQDPPLPSLRQSLSNTGYQEITGVAMPGRSITGGFALQIGN